MTDKLMQAAVDAAMELWEVRHKDLRIIDRARIIQDTIGLRELVAALEEAKSHVIGMTSDGALAKRIDTLLAMYK